MVSISVPRPAPPHSTLFRPTMPVPMLTCSLRTQRVVEATKRHVSRRTPSRPRDVGSELQAAALAVVGRHRLGEEMEDSLTKESGAQTPCHG